MEREKTLKEAGRGHRVLRSDDSWCKKGGIGLVIFRTLSGKLTPQEAPG